MCAKMCATAILIVIKHCYSNTYLEVLFYKQNIIYEVFNNCIFLIVWILRKNIFRGDEKTTFGVDKHFAVILLFTISLNFQWNN